jgi:hypothetical protein
MPQETLDPQAVNMAKAIRQTESGGNFTATGKSGEYGAYQYTEPTWQKDSAAVGVNVPLKSATPEQQNEVAYKTIKGLKDKGYNPGQIASIWNSGKPDAYLDPTYTGTNKYGAKYDVAAYAHSVANAYQAIKNGGSAGIDPNNPSSTANPQATGSQGGGLSVLPNLGGIGGELSKNITGRFNDLSTAATTANQGGVGHVASGILQAGGAIAGGVGDVVNAGLQLIPGVQAGEQLLGKGIGKLASTDTGQKVLGAYNDFAQTHPELAKDIGAGINVLAAIPLLRGLGIAKSAIADVGVNALRGKLTTAAGTEIRNALTTKTAVNSLTAAEKRGLNPVGLLTSDAKLLPDVVDSGGGRFVYSSTNPAKTLAESLATDETQLQDMLGQAVKKNIGVDLNTVRQQLVQDMIREFPVSARGGQAIKAVNEFIDNVLPTTKGRMVIDVNELNKLKRDIGGGVNWNNLGTQSGEIKSAMYRSLMTQVEKYASKAGVQGVKNLNKTMGQKIEAMKILKSIDGKALKVKGGLGKEIATDVAGVAGETAGNMLGIPFAGTLASRGLAGSIARRAPKSAIRSLVRASNSKGTLQKGLIKLGTGLAGSRTTQTQPQ